MAIYIARVRDTMEYAAQVFHPLLNQSQSDELEDVQKTCLRIILGPKSGSYQDNMALLGLSSLASRRRELAKKFAISCYKSTKHR